MGVIIDSSKYDKEITEVFKSSPLAYRKSEALKDKIDAVVKKAFEIFKTRDYYEAACIYKAIFIHAIDYLKYMKDSTGIIGDVIFDSLTYYSHCIHELDLDKAVFFRETLDFFIEEDMGFTHEISNLILNNTVEEDIELLEDLILERLEKEKANTYLHDKILKLLLSLYKKFGIYDKYLEACKKFETDRQERYVLAADMLTSINKKEQAQKQFLTAFENIKSPMQLKIVQSKYEEWKKKNE